MRHLVKSHMYKSQRRVTRRKLFSEIWTDCTGLHARALILLEIARVYTWLDPPHACETRYCTTRPLRDYRVDKSAGDANQSALS